VGTGLIRVSMFQAPVAIAQDGYHWTVVVASAVGAGGSFDAAYRAALRAGRRRA